MNIVNGKVIVKESGVGIPNLLIVLYDFDPNTKMEEQFSPNKPSSDLNYWNRIQGDRMGSVLTNENGAFEFKFEDSEYQGRNKEKRPDLILYVMAPEENQNTELRTSTPPQQRILYFSNVPRANAGRIESYIIKLSTSRLEKCGALYLPTSQTPTSRKENLLNSLDRSFDLQDAVQEKIKERSTKKTKERLEVSKKAKKAFENFHPSSFNEEQLADPSYLAPGDNLKDNQEKIMVLRQILWIKKRRLEYEVSCVENLEDRKKCV